jgi:hypothetical protein
MTEPQCDYRSCREPRTEGYRYCLRHAEIMQRQSDAQSQRNRERAHPEIRRRSALYEAAMRDRRGGGV